VALIANLAALVVAVAELRQAQQHAAQAAAARAAAAQLHAMATRVRPVRSRSDRSRAPSRPEAAGAADTARVGFLGYPMRTMKVPGQQEPARHRSGAGYGLLPPRRAGPVR
jgi:hypothetical protein